MTKLVDLGEYKIHHWLRQCLRTSELDPVGIGDDCAVLDLGGDFFILLTSDRVPTTLKGNYAGQFCVIHNFSDIVSKGGSPIGLLLDVYLRREADFEEDFQSIIKGAEAEKYGARIIGGDVKEFSRLIIVGTGIGRVKKENFLPRHGAKVGDVTAVTLTGGVKWGGRFAHIVSQYFRLDLPQEIQHCLKSIYKSSLTIPHKETIAASRVGGVSSCMDMSDGLGAALELSGELNQAGYRINQAALESCLDHSIVYPVAERLGVDPVRFCFSPGYDWENFLTISPEAFDSVQRAIRATGGEIVAIGEVTEQLGTELLLKDGSTIKKVNLFSDEQSKPTKWEDEPIAWREFELFREHADEQEET